MSAANATGDADVATANSEGVASSGTSTAIGSRGRSGRLKLVAAPVRPSRFAVAAMISLAVAAFGAVGINILRVDGQRRLDAVNAEIVSEQARTDSLRRSESRIQSPAEVVRIATEELGLVPAAQPKVVAAPPWVVAPPTATDGADSGSKQSTEDPAKRPDEQRASKSTGD